MRNAARRMLGAVHLRQQGIALLLVLWVVAILSVLALSFSVAARTDNRSSRAFTAWLQKKALAEAGIEQGFAELFSPLPAQEAVSDPTVSRWRFDGTRHEVRLGAGAYVVSIADESGKLDLNMLNDASGIILKNLLMNSGLGDEDASTIVDSLLDWKDSGDSDAHRLHGAESDYYLSLPNPYRAKNGLLDAVEEFLFVRGVTEEIMYGSGEKKGISRFLTIHSGAGAINVNAAAQELLASVPGVTPEIAETIVTARAAKPLSTTDLRVLLGESTAAALPYLSISGGSVFTIEAEGSLPDEAAGYPVKATVAVDGASARVIAYKSPARERP